MTLVRHGETDWNLQRRIQGSADIPLNTTGIAQAGAAAASLAGAGYSAVYSSPQSRALHTARIIADAMHADPETDADLRERSFGEAEGLTDPEVIERFPDQVVPGKETRRSVVERTLPVLHRIARRHPGESVLVVTHGAVISSLVLHLTDGALPRPGDSIRNLSLSHFTHEDGSLGLGDFNVPSHDAELIRAESPAAVAAAAAQDPAVSWVRA
nr:histidine phosphatase family protein [Planctomonas sp. JC2975]